MTLQDIGNSLQNTFNGVNTQIVQPAVGEFKKTARRLEWMGMMQPPQTPTPIQQGLQQLQLGKIAMDRQQPGERLQNITNAFPAPGSGRTAIQNGLQQAQLAGIATQRSFGQPDANGVGTNYGPLYTEPGLISASTKIGNLGFTGGIDHGAPFGSMNMNGQEKGGFDAKGFLSGLNNLAQSHPQAHQELTQLATKMHQQGVDPQAIAHALFDAASQIDPANPALDKVPGLGSIRQFNRKQFGVKYSDPNVPKNQRLEDMVNRTNIVGEMQMTPGSTPLSAEKAKEIAYTRDQLKFNQDNLQSAVDNYDNYSMQDKSLPDKPTLMRYLEYAKNAVKEYDKKLGNAIPGDYIRDTRPAHQQMLEQAFKVGDFTKAQAIIDSLPISDPYKASMQGVLDSIKPPSIGEGNLGHLAPPPASLDMNNSAVNQMQARDMFFAPRAGEKLLNLSSK